MKDLAVLALVFLAFVGGALFIFLFAKAIMWFFRQRECDQIETAIQLLLIIIVALVMLISQYI